MSDEDLSLAIEVGKRIGVVMAPVGVGLATETVGGVAVTTGGAGAITAVEVGADVAETVDTTVVLFATGGGGAGTAGVSLFSTPLSPQRVIDQLTHCPERLFG